MSEWSLTMLKSSMAVEESVRIGAKHQITIPRRVSDALRLKTGDYMLMRVVDDRVEMVAASLVPKDQLWFWTPEWQQMEHEAEEDIRHGRVKTFESVDELIKDLKS